MFNMLNNQKLLALVALAIVILAVGVVVLTASRNVPESQAAQLLAPRQYQEQFTTQNVEHVLLDVRTPAEFTSGHIPGAINISVQSLPDRLSEIPSDQPVVVYCRSGNRSAAAARILADAGYKEIYDLGGIIAWTAQGLPVE